MQKKKKIGRKRTQKYRLKNGKMQPYISKRRPEDPLSVWWWENKKRSKDTIKNIPKHLRPTINPTVFVFDVMVYVDPEDLSNREKLEKLAILTVGRVGVFYMMMPGHKKNKFGVSYKCKAIITITDSSRGLQAKVIEIRNMHRYWFWEKDRG